MAGLQNQIEQLSRKEPEKVAKLGEKKKFLFNWNTVNVNHTHH